LSLHPRLEYTNLIHTLTNSDIIEILILREFPGGGPKEEADPVRGQLEGLDRLELEQKLQEGDRKLRKEGQDSEGNVEVLRPVVSGKW
jgi:hypothetical protein